MDDAIPRFLSAGLNVSWFDFLKLLMAFCSLIVISHFCLCFGKLLVVVYLNDLLCCTYNFLL